MISRGLRIGVVVGGFLVLLGVGLHTVLRLYNAPEDVEFGLLNIFVATFASTMLTFFICILAADFQVERDKKERSRRLASLLEAELGEILRALNATPARLKLSDGTTVEVAISRTDPVVLGEVARDGVFTGPRASEAVRLLTRMRSYDAKVAYFTSLLSRRDGGEREKELVVFAAELKELREEIVAGLEMLSEESANPTPSPPVKAPGS